MGKYTISDDPEADRTVQNILDRICSGITDLLGDNLTAIVLVGGYGRGEGGIYWNDSGYQLVNDLDLLVFVSGNLKRLKSQFGDRIKYLSKKILENGRGLKDIDIELTNSLKYRYFMPNTVGNYEIANGHKVLLGDIDLKKTMIDIDASRLSPYEGTNYFRNRGSGMLIPAVYVVTGGLNDHDNQKNFQIELQKACQAMGDSYLLLRGEYHFSYRERLRRFNEVSRDTGDIPPVLLERVAGLYDWGISSKLTPVYSWRGDALMIDLWFEVQEVMSDFFLWYESSRLRRHFGTWTDYAQYVNRCGCREPVDIKLRSALKLLLSGSRLIRKERTMSQIQKFRYALSVMPLLLFSLERGLNVKSSLLSEAAIYMKNEVHSPDLSLWKELVAMYLMAYYPKGVVIKALMPILGEA